jgi:RHS repeat-associated protein
VVRNGVNEYYGVDAADKLLWTNRTNALPTAGQANPYTLFSYDAFGNMVRRDRKDSAGTRKIVDFAWDSDGRLRQALDETTATSLLTASYTADGERVTKTDVTTGGHVYSYGLFDSNASTWYTPGLSQRKGLTGPDRHFHSDWLGSTRYLSDGAGTGLPAALRYDAYGSRSAFAGTDPAHPTDFQFAGYAREADGSLGLVYLDQRYYDPAVGRFVSRDPIGWAGGITLYGYSDNDPVNGADPSGLSVTWEGGLGRCAFR